MNRLVVGATVCWVVIASCSESASGPTAPTEVPALGKAKPGGIRPTAEIAFLSSVGNSGTGRVVVINGDGSNQVNVSSYSAGYPPSWSGSGSGTQTSPWRLAYNPGFATITIVDVDTAGGAVHVRNPRSFSFSTNAIAPRWKPGGDSIVFSASTSLRIVGANGGPAAVLYDLANQATNRVHYSTWRSDGTALAFVETSPWAVRVLNRNTGLVTTVTPAGFSGDMRQLDWARTRDELALSARDANGVMGTWIVSLVRDVSGNFAATAPPRVLNASRGWPSWSPDDSQLVLDGLRTVDYATGAILQQFGNGGAADWRR